MKPSRRLINIWGLEKTPSLQWNNCLCTSWPYSQIFCSIFVCVPNSGQAVIRIFNRLSIDKGETTLLFQKWWVTFAQTGQAQNTLKGFIPKIKSGSHVFISKVVKVSSSRLRKNVAKAYNDQSMMIHRLPDYVPIPWWLEWWWGRRLCDTFHSKGYGHIQLILINGFVRTWWQ